MELLRYACLGSVFACVLSWVLVLGEVKPIPEGRNGYAAKARRKALVSSHGWAIIEPCIRWCGGLWALWGASPWLRPSLQKLSEKQRRDLEAAGDWLGLTPEELSGTMMAAMMGFGAVGAAVSVAYQSGMLYMILGIVAGPGLVRLQLESEIRKRQKLIGRGLPPLIDLAALCTSAGLDLPASLALATQNAKAGDPLAEELSRMLDALRLGQTRREALLSFERRAPIPPVRDLVRALIQAEQKGTPISEVLLVQARVSRNRRSVMAEEAATRAGVLLIVPMVLLFGCILLLLVGPFFAGGAEL